MATYRQVCSWGIPAVADWLQQEGFGKHIKIFQDNYINGEKLLVLDEAKIKNMYQIPLNDRRRILRLIADLKEQLVPEPPEDDATNSDSDWSDDGCSQNTNQGHTRPQGHARPQGHTALPVRQQQAMADDEGPLEVYEVPPTDESSDDDACNYTEPDEELNLQNRQRNTMPQPPAKPAHLRLASAAPEVNQKPQFNAKAASKPAVNPVPSRPPKSASALAAIASSHEQNDLGMADGGGSNHGSSSHGGSIHGGSRGGSRGGSSSHGSISTKNSNDSLRGRGPAKLPVAFVPPASPPPAETPDELYIAPDDTTADIQLPQTTKAAKQGSGPMIFNKPKLPMKSAPDPASHAHVEEKPAPLSNKGGGGASAGRRPVLAVPPSHRPQLPLKPKSEGRATDEEEAERTSDKREGGSGGALHGLASGSKKIRDAAQKLGQSIVEKITKSKLVTSHNSSNAKRVQCTLRTQESNHLSDEEDNGPDVSTQSASSLPAPRHNGHRPPPPPLSAKTKPVSPGQQRRPMQPLPPRPEPSENRHNQSDGASESGSDSGAISRRRELPPLPDQPKEEPRLPSQRKEVPMLPSQRKEEPMLPGQRKDDPKPPAPCKEEPRPPVQRQEQPKSKRPAEIPLEQQPWFHPNMNRPQAKAALQALNKDGAFVVRGTAKASATEPYSLSVFYGKDFHLLIRLKNGQYALGTEKPDEMTFSSITEMVNYHKTVPISLSAADGSCTASTVLTVFP